MLQILKFREPIEINQSNFKDGLDCLYETNFSNFESNNNKLNSIIINKNSIVKPDNPVYSDTGKARENEDRINVLKTNNSYIFGVADGAGSSGIYCGEWAEMLLENIPKNPIKNCLQLNLWVQNVFPDFYHKYKSISDDDFIKNKFINEGSYCSLLIAWLTCNYNKYKLESIIYGDTSLFIFQKDATLKQLYPYDSVDQFKNSPYLISLLKDANQEHFIHKTFDIDSSDIIIAATDGFAKFLLSQYILYIQSKKKLSTFDKSLYEKNKDFLSQTYSNKLFMYDKDFKRLLNTIKSKLSNNTDSFKLFAKELYYKKFLPNDDCSIIFIDFDEKSLSNINDQTSENENVNASHKIRIDNGKMLSLQYNDKWVKELLENILSNFPNIIKKDKSLVDIISNYFVFSKEEQ